MRKRVLASALAIGSLAGLGAMRPATAGYGCPVVRNVCYATWNTDSSRYARLWVYVPYKYIGWGSAAYYQDPSTTSVQVAVAERGATVGGVTVPPAEAQVRVAHTSDGQNGTASAGPVTVSNRPPEPLPTLPWPAVPWVSLRP